MAIESETMLTEVSKIEDQIAAGEINAPAVFTRMRYMLRQALESRTPSADEPKVSSEAKDAWQQIQTAPKDGSVFICSRRSGRRGLNHWSHEFHSWNHVIFDDPMTHWMPLPGPPAIAQQESKTTLDAQRGGEYP